MLQFRIDAQKIKREPIFAENEAGVETEEIKSGYEEMNSD